MEPLEIHNQTATVRQFISVQITFIDCSIHLLRFLSSGFNGLLVLDFRVNERSAEHYYYYYLKYMNEKSEKKRKRTNKIKEETKNQCKNVDVWK